MKQACLNYLFIYLLIIYFYFWLRWAFVAVRGLSLAAVSRCYSLVAASHRCGFRHLGFNSCNMWAQELQLTGSVAPRQVESFWTRDQSHVPCTGRRDSYPWYHQGSPEGAFYKSKKPQAGLGLSQDLPLWSDLSCSRTGRSFLADTSHVPTGQGGSSKWSLPTFRTLPWVTPITEGPKWMSTPLSPLAPGKLRVSWLSGPRHQRMRVTPGRPRPGL